jgi:hypothetical protein
MEAKTHSIILSTAYLGSIQYFAKLAHFPVVIIEQYDSYQKQTFRNRCRVLGGNGPLDLIIPVVKNHGQKTLVKDVQIEYQTRWQDIHWRTIVSAYNNSPFFEYYRDDFEPFYSRPWKFLIDFNQQINELLLGLLELEPRVSLTQTYQHETNNIDYRALISPGNEAADPHYRVQTYTQTFHDRFGFVPHLSMIDLLFNTGTEAGEILQLSYKTD